jgi:hypothetical protein
MTQRASPETVLADFGDVTLTVADKQYRLHRSGDDFLVEMDDPLAPPGSKAARVVRRIGTTTGSHHMQVYWFESGYTRITGLLPFAWQIAEQRWIPRHAAFVLPVQDQIDPELGSWNYICIKCHATNHKPKLDWPSGEPLRGADTHVSEFGIACEACHGPGAEHVAANQDPIRRYSHHLSGDADPTMVNPARLDHVLSTQVCGQCHGQWEYWAVGEMARVRDFFAEGFRYRPGQDLLKQRKLKFEGEDQFWPDGLIRVAGREYNALVGSGCFDRGEMSCLSCHVAHQATDDPRPRAQWTDDMLGPASLDRTCLQCHPSYEQDVPAHTHHAAGSEGSRCHNCHMPHTTYGLMKGVRTHRIANPSVTSTLATGRPNACNQCHLDRTLAWTAEHLHAWYGTPVPQLAADDRTIAAAVQWTLRGDAAQRALMAWSLGWEPARQASGRDWIVPYLAELLDDPYDAVRVIAERSLRTMPGYEGFRHDLVGAPAARAAAKDAALAAWRQTATASLDPRRLEVLLAPDGSLRTDEFARLLKLRNHREVKLLE